MLWKPFYSPWGGSFGARCGILRGAPFAFFKKTGIFPRLPD